MLRTRAARHPEWTDERLFRGAVKIWTADPIDVVVRLSSDVAHLAPEYPLVPEQRIDPRADGTVRIHARVAGLVEAKRWILTWGASAEALEPTALREAVRTDLEDALQPYLRKRARRSDPHGRSPERPARPEPGRSRKRS